MKKIQPLPLGDRKLLLHEKIYCPETITKMLWTYTLRAFAEHLNKLKVNDDGITPMYKFAGTKTDITLKNFHTWAVQFMYWMKDFKATYVYSPSGDLANVQGSILVTHHDN